MCGATPQSHADALRLSRPFGAVADFAAIGEPSPRSELRRVWRPRRQIDRVHPARLPLDVDRELAVPGAIRELDFACDHGLVAVAIEAGRSQLARHGVEVGLQFDGNALR